MSGDHGPRVEEGSGGALGAMPAGNRPAELGDGTIPSSGLLFTIELAIPRSSRVVEKRYNHSGSTIGSRHSLSGGATAQRDEEIRLSGHPAVLATR